MTKSVDELRTLSRGQRLSADEWNAVVRAVKREVSVPSGSYDGESSVTSTRVPLEYNALIAVNGSEDDVPPYSVFGAVIDPEVDPQDFDQPPRLAIDLAVDPAFAVLTNGPWVVPANGEGRARAVLPGELVLLRGAVSGDLGSLWAPDGAGALEADDAGEFALMSPPMTTGGGEYDDVRWFSRRAAAAPPATKARFIRFTLSAALTTADATRGSCPVKAFYDGTDPGATVTVHNTPDDAAGAGNYLWAGDSGATGWAFYDPVGDTYHIFNLKCQVP